MKSIQLPTAWQMIRWLSALYCGGMGAILLGLYLWEVVTLGAPMLKARAVAVPMGTADAVCFGLWLFSTVITGWSAMDRKGPSNG